LSTTRYFDEQVLLRRPYLTVALCRAIIDTPIARVAQDDRRIRFWGRITLPNEQNARILRAVTLEDGLTIHNAFIDRNFREDGK
jgi:hypothetical protein